MLVYRKKAMSFEKVSEMLDCILVANSVDVIAGHFNYHL